MRTDDVSPDETVRVRWDENEVRMSICLQNPVVVRERDAKTIAVFPSSWHCDIVEWSAPGRVTFDAMNYPRGDIRVRVSVDVESERCTIDGDERPAPQLEKLLDDALDRAIAPALMPDGACPYCANASAVVVRGTRKQCLICERFYPAT